MKKFDVNGHNTTTKNNFTAFFIRRFITFLFARLVLSGAYLHLYPGCLYEYFVTLALFLTKSLKVDISPLKCHWKAGIQPLIA